MRFAILALVIIIAACASRAPTCDPQQAWDRAAAGLPTDSRCETDPLWREASNLGGHYHTLSRRYDALLNAEQGYPGDGAARLERIRLERELNEVRGAAQVRGWLPPQLR